MTPFEQHWIWQLATHAVFRPKVVCYWQKFYAEQRDSVEAEIDKFVDLISEAAVRDAERWADSDNVKTNPDMQYSKARFLELWNWRINWLQEQWGDGEWSGWDDVSSTDQPFYETKRFVDGRLLIERNGVLYDLLGSRVE